jgi:hypothetical protein
LNLDLEGINTLSLNYEKDTKALKEELFRMCWFMRGGLSFTEAYSLSPEDREIIAKIIADNIEKTNTSNMPFF